MRTLIHTLFFFLLVTHICFAQWYQQNSGTTKNLYAVHFTDANNGVAVGDSGTILRTTNGGTAWAIQASGIILPLNDICFTDVNNGWAVGSNVNNVIIHTTDGGTNWNTQLILPDSWLTDIFFIDENIGWVVGRDYYGGAILRTTNGGSTWIDQSCPTEMWLNDVYFVDANIGFIVGGYDFMYGCYGEIHKTTNGGDNWSEQITDPSIHCLGISFSDSLNGIVVGRKNYYSPSWGNIFRTTDGGINWIFAIEYGSAINGVTLINSNNVWAVGMGGYNIWGGTILFSSDKGVNWSEQAVVSSQLNSVSFINSSTGWAVGDNGIILQTTNGGVVPVELTSFTAKTNGKEVILNWSTATELNNQGFEIQRSTEGKEFFTVGFVNGQGTTTEHRNYSYADRNLDDGNYFYRLKQVDYDGSYEYSNVVEIDYRGFNSYLLEQNFPNPFNPTTTIGFGIQNKSNVKITILNSIGEEVAVILNEEREPGFYQVEFNAANLSSGVYFYQLKAAEYTSVKKMILIK